MTRRLFTWLLAASTGLLTATQATQLRADETSTSLYEDDAWYDITEWFDGNDYNPTDEQFFKWDDEVYDAEDAANSWDRDNDTASYGFDNSNTTDDWYYDYDYNDYSSCDDYDANGRYELWSQYYDYDNDGYYDAYSSYLDWDGDGVYEDYSYLSFASSGHDEQKADQAKKDAAASKAQRNAKMFAVDGQIESLKQVKGISGKRLIAHVANNNDQKVVVDLGSPGQFETKLAKGDEITARGPVTKVGDKQVLVAKQVEHEGTSKNIDRSPRHLSGKIVDTMKSKPRSDQAWKHMLVKLQTEEGKQALVDLGPADQLKVDLKQGQEVDVSGVAVKMQQRPVLFASKISVDGKDYSIDRRTQKKDANSDSDATSRQARRESKQTSQN